MQPESPDFSSGTLNNLPSTSFRGRWLVFIRITGLFAIVLGILKIINDSYILKTTLDLAYAGNYDVYRPGFAITALVYLICFAYIVIGVRLLRPTHRNTENYIKGLLASSLVIGIYELSRPNYPLGYLLITLSLLLFCSEIIIRRYSNDPDFKSRLSDKPYLLGKKFWIILNIVSIFTLAALPLLEDRVYPKLVLKTYQNTSWDFQISYPEKFSLVEDKQNVEGTKNFLVPQAPYESSGYLSKIVEIADVISTTTKPLFRGYMQIVLLPSRPKNLDELEQQLKDAAASSTEQERLMGRKVFETIGSGEHKFPSILFIPKDKKFDMTRSVFVFFPPYEIFGKPQPSRLLRIDYSPGNSPTFEKIVLSLTQTPVTASDEELFRSAVDNKDNFWCDHIQDDQTKTTCHISVRGYPIIDNYPADLTYVAGQQGTVEIIGTSTIKLSTSKTNKAASSSASWTGFYITLNNNWQGVDFDATFSNNKKAESMLSIYWNKDIIGSIDGRLADPSEDFGPWYINDPHTSNNTHFLGFRLDSFASAGTTSVTISNIHGVSYH